MKKAIVLSVALLFATISNHLFAAPVDKTPEPGNKITTLIINANVTVVLVDNEKANLEVTGRSLLSELVTFDHNSDTLVIGSTKKKNLTEAGVIYVPAAQLRNIQINSGATVRSLYVLNIPKLDVVINGACYIQVSNIGELNLIETDKYAIDASREVREVPASILLSRKY
ncbi:MAG TPA: DUF2807 domain-containing protein [Chitinophagaceae bacterium]|nr:DUF2807 domain-containing protein [Chitinophagaceae bacterium]